MSFGVPSKVIAATFALAAFAVAVVAGLGAGNSGARVLAIAIVSMIVCECVGLVIGAIGERVVADHLAAYRAARPIPDTRKRGGPGGSGKTRLGVSS